MTAELFAFALMAVIVIGSLVYDNRDYLRQRHDDD